MKFAEQCELRSQRELIQTQREQIKELKQQLAEANKVISAAKDMTNDGNGFSMIDVYQEKWGGLE